MKRELNHSEGLGGIISMDHAYGPAIKESFAGFAMTTEWYYDDFPEIAAMSKLYNAGTDVMLRLDDQSMKVRMEEHLEELNSLMGTLIVYAGATKSHAEYDGKTEKPTIVSIQMKEIDGRHARDLKSAGKEQTFDADDISLTSIRSTIMNVSQDIIASDKILNARDKQELMQKSVTLSDELLISGEMPVSIKEFTDNFVEKLKAPEKYRSQFKRMDLREMGEGTISTQQMQMLKRDNMISPVIQALSDIRNDLENNETKRAYNAARASLLAIKDLSEKDKNEWSPTVDENNKLQLVKFTDGTVLDGKQYNTIELENNLSKLIAEKPKMLKSNIDIQTFRDVINDTIFLKGDLEIESIKIKRSGREGQFKYQIKLDRPEEGDKEIFDDVIANLQKIEGVEINPAKNGKSAFIKEAPDFIHDIMSDLVENRSQGRG